MADFEMEFELTGLKFKIKSERSEASQAIQSVQNQIGSILQAAAGLGPGENANGGSGSHGQPLANKQNRTIEGQTRSESTTTDKAKTVKGKRSAAGGSAASVDFSHDAAKYGFPTQGWNTAQKAMWLLYVTEKQTAEKELSTATIAATFGKHFKEFGTITTTNTTRDLGRAKVKSSFVGSNVSKIPPTWYLLEAGKKEVEKLIKESQSEKVDK